MDNISSSHDVIINGRKNFISKTTTATTINTITTTTSNTITTTTAITTTNTIKPTTITTSTSTTITINTKTKQAGIELGLNQAETVSLELAN